MVVIDILPELLKVAVTLKLYSYLWTSFSASSSFQYVCYEEAEPQAIKSKPFKIHT